MVNLKSVLGQHVGSVVELGGSGAKLDLRKLRGDLEIIRKRNETIFWVCAVMTVTLFAIVVYTTFFSRTDSPIISHVLQGGLGITVFGLIVYMFRLWRNKLYTEVLMAMAVNGDEPSLRQLMIVIRKVLLSGADSPATSGLGGGQSGSGTTVEP